jgi:hypothetical protein
MSLLVIALSGADGGVAQHLMDEGRMPHLLGLVEAGASGDIPWTQGDSAVADWLTVATGRPAWAHGVLANPVARADGFGVTYAERSNMRAAPVWERVARQGDPVHAIGWPATHGTCPAAEMPGLSVVADTFFHVEGRSATNWPAFPESVSPRVLTRDMVSARVHPDQLKEPPWRQRLGMPGEAVTRTAGQRGLAQMARLESAIGVSESLEGAPAARFVYLDMLEVLGLPGSQAELMGAMAAYTLLDMAVGRLVALAGPGADVVVMTRPPAATLMGEGTGIVPRGLAVFRTRGHQPDSLLPPSAPMELAAALGDIAGAGGVVVPTLEMEEDTETATSQLAQKLAGRHQIRCKPLRADRMAIQKLQERDRAIKERALP